jgi:peptide methionine sulfoxide reductase msrA/msrB
VQLLIGWKQRREDGVIMKILSLILLLSISVKAEIATFAGGCFWCMEPPFEKGEKESANYKQVSNGTTAHLEVVQVDFDPKKVTYNELLEVFWRNIDPTQTDGQFVDKGPQYLSAIFYHSDIQKNEAKKSKEELNKSKKFSKPIYTKVLKALKFYPAEEYHQDYYKKSTFRYKLYRVNSGRDEFIKKYWDSN